MERVEQDLLWSLFDPKMVPQLCDLHGEAFEQAYLEAEEAGLFVRQVPARQLYARMMRTLAQTGNGWMTFKDAANRKCNQTALPERVVHLSNLCTEILEVSSDDETAVCNLGSVNLGRLVGDGDFDFERLGEIVRVAVPFLDRVIDINFYPTSRTAASNERWRPVGIGMMGLQDVFFRLRLPFDSDEARSCLGASPRRSTSTRCGPRASWPNQAGRTHFAETQAARALQFDLWGVGRPTRALAGASRAHRPFGLRNSLLVAIAPTATIASIADCYECIEPQVSNLFKRETLSASSSRSTPTSSATCSARALERRGPSKIKAAEGSVQGIGSSRQEAVFRTAWELPMRH